MEYLKNILFAAGQTNQRILVSYVILDFRVLKN